ncbi:MAG: zinc ribbon domain-containing protein, partial [Candidatus Lokiarchaeota archaeon]|nr:zinc ribbon domain-containing protein [Candidatus Lokiarchaeota archaeon]
FNYSDNFNWIGYSLDGNPNITITGNKVILVPEIGIHSIILNGITSEGMVIQSELRLFTIFIQDPPIIDYPGLIPIFLTSIVLGIIALLGITLLLIRRKMFSRTSSIIISPAESRIVENIDSRRDQINFCPICGAKADNINQYCAYCGASFKDI